MACAACQVGAYVTTMPADVGADKLNDRPEECRPFEHTRYQAKPSKSEKNCIIKDTDV